MAVLVLNNDITNAHRIDGAGVDALAYDAHEVKRVGGHEAQTIWEVARITDVGTESRVHIVVNNHSFSHETLEARARKLRKATRKGVPL